jgi:hypothetical protein
MQPEKCTMTIEKMGWFRWGGLSIFLALFLMLAGCEGGGGESSQVIQAPPSTPTGVHVAISGPNELSISWDSVANANSYNIYWTTAPGANKTSSRLSGITAPNFIHTGRNTGTTYYYVVTAVNDFGESGESVEVFALLDIPRPTGAISAVAGDKQVALSWSANGAESYNIYMASQPGVTKANYATLADGAVHASTMDTYTVTNLTNGKTYYFVVTSINSFGESAESSEMAVTPAVSGSLLISGLIKYEDKEYGTNGFTGNTTFKAVRFAEVQAVDTLSGATIISGVTDDTGSYFLTMPFDVVNKEIYIRVITSSLTPAIEVKDLSGVLHAVTGSPFTIAGDVTANISAQVTSPVAGAFNILDSYVGGAQFIQSLTGSFPPALAVYWETGNPNGTYFCSSSPDPYCPYGEAIYILNASGDTDEYDDDVLWHEYGHFIAAKYSKDDSPGGIHYLSSNDMDLRLSWSEGWGDFFPTAVKTWLSITTPAILSTVPMMSASIYVDTWGGGASSFDFQNPGGSPYIYSGSEVAVAKVLLALNSNYGMQAIWDTFSSSYFKNAVIPVNLEVFGDAWNSLVQADIAAIFSERMISYYADSYEVTSDNLPAISRKLAVGANENHTLFGSADIDNIAFDAVAGQTYTVKTSALKNGADTYIRIIAPDQLSTVVVNDNSDGADYSLYPFVPNRCNLMTGECHENGFDILGSAASFTATASGTYYVEVQSSPSRPLSAGQYGDYLLTITSP